MTPADIPVALGVCHLAAPDWSSAACLIEDPELFFPISARPDRRTAEAKAVCGTCPVRDDCLTYATETRQQHGVWGGLSEDERRAIARRAERDATKARKAASVAAVEAHCSDQRARVATLTAQGMSAAAISLWLGISARQVNRNRAQNRQAQEARR